MRACEDSSSLLELRIQDNPFGFRFSLFRALPCRDMSIQPCQVPLLKWWILHPFAIQHGQGYVGYHSGGIRWLSFVGGHECTWLPCHFCSFCEQIFCLMLPFVICITTFGVLQSLISADPRCNSFSCNRAFCQLSCQDIRQQSQAFLGCAIRWGEAKNPGHPCK